MSRYSFSMIPFKRGVATPPAILVPTGLIIPLDDTTIPLGWARFTAMDGYHPVGAGTTYAVGGTGGAACSISRTSSSDGDHYGDATTMANCPAGGTTNYGSNGIGGSYVHSHTITATYNRPYQNLVLIKAGSDLTTFPAKGIVLGKTSSAPIVGLTQVYSSDKILRGYSSLSTGGGLTGQACSYDGSHIHNADLAGAAGGETYTLPSNVYAGSHTHVVTMSISTEELKRTYLTAWSSTSAFSGSSGFIAMWEGTTAPAGWRLCDGGGGTLDLRDYFIILSSVGNAGTQNNESNRVYVTASLNADGWWHTHEGAPISEVLPVATARHSAGGAYHSHTSTAAWHSYTPPYYGITFIEKVAS